MNIISLFPTPVSQSKIQADYDFDAILSELKFVKNEGGNEFSINQKILDFNNLSTLKKQLTEHVKTFVESVHVPQTPIEVYITNSWINISTPGNSHHKHSHVNSFISGVYYIKANETDSITFYHNRYDQIKVTPKDYNIFNSDSWSIPITTGDLVLFPSYLDHGVLPCKNNQRISLAFNTFIKGNIGNESSSTNLELR